MTSRVSILANPMPSFCLKARQKSGRVADPSNPLPPFTERGEDKGGGGEMVIDVDAANQHFRISEKKSRVLPRVGHVISFFHVDISQSVDSVYAYYIRLGNAGISRNQRYRTGPDTGIPMPD
jgi:hypothetical protein